MAVRPVAAVKKLVIIEEGLLTSMAGNAKFVKEFPCLKPIQGVQAAPRAGCSSCGGNRRAGTERSVVYTKVKADLASMGDDKRRLLKQMLNAKQVRLTYKQGSRVVQHTF